MLNGKLRRRLGWSKGRRKSKSRYRIEEVPPLVTGSLTVPLHVVCHSSKCVATLVLFLLAIPLINR